MAGGCQDGRWPNRGIAHDRRRSEVLRTAAFGQYGAPLGRYDWIRYNASSRFVRVSTLTRFWRARRGPGSDAMETGGPRDDVRQADRSHGNAD
jgi:hypothetical protein